MAVIAKSLLLGATKPPQEIVNLPELGAGAYVWVRGMTGAERDAFEVSLVEGRGRKREVNLKNLRAKLIAFCCVDDDGNRLYTNEDAAALGDVRADVMNRIYTVAQRLSGLSDEDADELGQPSTKPVVSTSSSSGSPVN